MRPPNTHDKDMLTALHMAEECEQRARQFPDKSYLHGLRNQWLERACSLERKPTPSDAPTR